MRDLLYAIKYLPEELFTPAIVEAAINRGNIEVLNHLPEQYLTPENILVLVEKDKTSWSSFNLGKIPDRLKSEELCACAVKHSPQNYLYIPENRRTQELSDRIISQTGYHLQLLEYIPAGCWNRENACTALNSIYGKPYSSHSYNSYSQKDTASEKFLPVQVLLSHLPEKIKNREFYLGLFTETSISAQELQALIPERYKNAEYDRLLAKNNFTLVPESKYSYRLFLEALNGKSDYLYRTLQNQNAREKFFSCMDDTLAEAFVKNMPDCFSQLPAQFQTAERMLYVIENNPDYSQFNRIIKNGDANLLTGEVCRALVKHNSFLPVFPENIWNEGFVGFCMKNAGYFYWFEQMPQRFQTQEIVNQVLKERKDYLQYVHPAFINSRLAMELFRFNGRMKSCLPEKYFTGFVQATGLPEEFYGGETTFHDMKNNRQNYSWCQTGNACIGYYTDCGYHNSVSFVIMTRAASHEEQPQVVFNRRVGSFHKTWLEKMIADYDRDFVKPTVNKALKDVQPNLYCGVETAGVKDGVEFFRITFRGETIAFAGRKGGAVLHRETREEVVAGFQASNAA